MEIQIDVKEVSGNHVVCNLYTGERCVKIIMHTQDYEALKRDGFFIRDGKTKDSADIINTTRMYKQQA